MSAPAKSFLGRLLAPLARPYRAATHYPRIGLRYDDLIDEENDVVKEALRRLPQHEVDGRVMRIRRAMQCSLSHSELPKNEWTTVEQDIRYLTPLVEEVKQEFAERRAYDAMEVSTK
ncbi:MAG: ubiquinol-cytochrome c reductase subunit 7 [Piptocephalis tieghemiana]|nr:MAG: ubiquinol-cytochrome c reductase subunit 7 [Piptocephalis tieghemiana]